MENTEVPQLHEHPLIPFTRFAFSRCGGCCLFDINYIYGGYRCNELGCETIFHKECAEPLPEINHSSHPDHPLKLTGLNLDHPATCSLCQSPFMVGYCCSICDFKLDLGCATRPTPLLILDKSKVHEHPLQLFYKTKMEFIVCKTCDAVILFENRYYGCHQCELAFHVDCVETFPEAYHTCHREHPLKFFICQGAPDYADKECLLCGMVFSRRFHHCDVCNLSICSGCMGNPPPLGIVSPTTHEHQLHLVARRIGFTCNACGTQGDRSPYFCLECNFMIHRDCIDLPRVININRHDHRISYTRRLGHGNWKCGVCRKKVNGFYGAYACSICSTYVVHSRCITYGMG